MYRDYLIAIVEKSFKTLEKGNEADLRLALLRINNWANELYKYHNKEVWYKTLKTQSRGGSWGYDSEECVKVCPCGEEDNYTEAWRELHYSHDEEFARSLSQKEEYIGSYLKNQI